MNWVKWVFDQSADCPQAEARHGQTGVGLSCLVKVDNSGRWLIDIVARPSLSIVLKPKPATVRLEWD
ncbi:hypothetical protein N7491_002013 [Penicillium cf. griseofulvum]|uniref:Uncharacterized protein n=1 Tax=Penicillium cf. griseofulvum TaxID=2972120 RepID=A0A9W9MU24_9EURO|nr:hypothetical protein N7472_003802 [Penicillium cf. griseofulvum]KAJ5445931.1 hypothetical protein N7491_002013 [Penicillium cf. griseofulvum]KAJ5447654.1 hypothetical protein N7445_002475 [Penicillium cf. griseofulvum]